jgi:hypothetical protein
LRKALKGILAFSLLLGIMLAPVSALACPSSSDCNQAPACPAPKAMKCPETVVFVNDTQCADQHLKITYRTKGLLGRIFKKNLHVTLQPGEVYTWTYDNAAVMSKSVSIKKGLLCSTTQKVQSNQIWLVSEVKKGHNGMPFGASPKPVTSLL